MAEPPAKTKVIPEVKVAQVHGRSSGKEEMDNYTGGGIPRNTELLMARKESHAQFLSWMQQC